MTTYISINACTIRKNATKGTNEPPIRIAKSRTDSKPKYAHNVTIHGPSILLYNPDSRILKSGARLVLVTEAEVETTE